MTIKEKLIKEAGKIGKKLVSLELCLNLLDQQKQEILKIIDLDFRRKSGEEWEEKNSQNLIDKGHNIAISKLKKLRQKIDEI